MDAFAQKFFDFCTAAQPIVIAAVCVAFGIIGIMFILPSEEAHMKAKKYVFFVIIGSAIALGCVTIGRWLTESMAF